MNIEYEYPQESQDIVKLRYSIMKNTKQKIIRKIQRSCNSKTILNASTNTPRFYIKNKKQNANVISSDKQKTALLLGAHHLLSAVSL